MNKKTNPEKKTRKVLENIMFLLKNAWQWDKLLFFYLGAYTVLTAISPFINIFAIKFLLDELLGFKRIEILVGILAVMFISQALVNFFIAVIKHGYEPKLILIRFKFINMLQVKNMTMDFKHTESPDTLNKMESAWQSVNTNQTGIEGVFHRIFNLLGSAISFGGYMTLVFTLSPWVLLYLVINVGFTYVLTLKVKTYEHSKKEERADLNRRLSYIVSTMLDFKFGKDIRIYQLGDWLGTKFNVILNKQLKLLKDIETRFFYVGLTDICLMMIREIIIYG